MSPSQLWFVPVFCLLVLSPTTATAQSGERSVQEQVEDHNQKGLAHYEKGEYPEAISEMLKAYQLIPEPALLYNVARIYHKMGEQGLAKDYYRKFVSHENADPDSVKKALAYLKEIQQEEAPVSGAPAPLSETLPATGEAVSSKAPKEQPASAPTNTQAVGSTTCLPCWLGVGAVVGAASVGGVTGYLALEQKSIYEENFDAAIRPNAAAASANYAGIADVSWGVAGVLSGVTGYLFYAHFKSAAEVGSNE